MEPMPTTHESVCCTKIGQLWQKVEEQWPEIQISCITEHPGFQSICPDVWVLETAYYALRQQRGTDNYTTGGPSSSCEMIILRNNSHGGIIRVCMGIFTTALRNKKIRQILKKNTSPYFHSVSFVIRPLTSMKRAHFSELFISRFSTYIRNAVENLEMNNSLKFVLFIKVSGQITSDTL